MATATDLIDAAMHKLQALAEGGSHNTAQGTLGLGELNRMLDSANSRPGSMLFQIQAETFTWTGANGSRTMGSGGNFSTTRPTKITDAAHRDSSGYDTPIPVTYDRSRWEAVRDKDQEGEPPEILFVDNGFATVTLNVWPVPALDWSFRVSSWKQLSSIATVGTTVSLPPAYEDYIVWNLAKRLYPTYPSDQVKDLVMMMAKETENVIRRLNKIIPTLQIDPALLYTSQSMSYDINRDS